MLLHFYRAICRSLVLFALVAPLHAYTASAAMIDFETLPGEPMTDGISIGAQYFAGQGMSFGLDLDGDGFADAGVMPTLEHIGVDTGWGFVNDVDHMDDEALPEYGSNLGTWLLATPIQSIGAALLITYSGGTDVASGEIWDIDGNLEQGTERWRIDALAMDGSVLASILSPIGDSYTPESLNATPWTFEFDRELADIWGLRIEFVGTKTWGLGAGFDNFYGTVPEPGTLAMLALGIGFLGRRARRS